MGLNSYASILSLIGNYLLPTAVYSPSVQYATLPRFTNNLGMSSGPSKLLQGSSSLYILIHSPLTFCSLHLLSTFTMSFQDILQPSDRPPGPAVFTQEHIRCLEEAAILPARVSAKYI
jgi:hypothetical protein